MVPILHTFTVLVVSVAMALAVAHALEMPGKRRLSRDEYVVVQRIYYPGFTMGGISEPLGVALVLVLLLVTPVASTTFWLLVAAVVGLVGMQAAYWLIVHPTNKVWLHGEDLGKYGAAFFEGGTARLPNKVTAWTTLRDRWEFAHLARAVLGFFSFVAVLVAKP